MVTIRDVAKQAGVSIKTVSRVVNNQSEVSSNTREKVQQVISELDYRPNSNAQSLVSGRTKTIGVVIPYDTKYVFSHPFFAEVIRRYC